VTESPQLTQRQLIAGSKAVHFRTSDGVRLAGRVFGHGPTAVILSHMGPQGQDQTEWWPLARVLAGHGYRVLAYDYRGICPGGPAGCSKGSLGNVDATTRDLAAATAFMRASGAKRIVLGGASWGSVLSIHAASLPDANIQALFSLSGVELAGGFYLNRDVTRRIPVPKLFLAGQYDDEAAQSARDWIKWSRPPVRGRILDTGLHGTDMIDLASGADAEIPGKVTDLVLSFLDRFAPA
jgi:predicted alpha/beta hydrolase